MQAQVQLTIAGKKTMTMCRLRVLSFMLCKDPRIHEPRASSALEAIDVYTIHVIYGLITPRIGVRLLLRRYIME